MSKCKDFKIVSDTHFFHEKLIEFKVRKYDSVKAMNEDIIIKWNMEIAPRDKVIHLGDFAFGSDFEAIEDVIKQLNGNITLVLGNHDTAAKVREIYTKYFKCVGGLSIGQYYFTHEPVHATVINPDQLRSTGRQATCNIHGHLHNGEYVSENHINCCMDVSSLVTRLTIEE